MQLFVFMPGFFVESKFHIQSLQDDGWTSCKYLLSDWKSSIAESDFITRQFHLEHKYPAQGVLMANTFIRPSSFPSIGEMS